MKYVYNRNDELIHFGILGQKWGVRRYQNEDGTRTEAGKRRAKYSDKQRRQDERLYGKQATKRIEKRMEDGESLLSARHQEVVNKGRKEKAKTSARRITKPLRDLSYLALGTATMLTVATVAKKAINGQKIDIKTLPRDVVDTGKKAINGVLGMFGV